MTDIDAFKKCMEDYLENYNDEKTPMHLILFLDACEHVSKICRVLRQPKGNMLLMGVGGSGRQSLTRLASYIQEFRCYNIEVVKG